MASRASSRRLSSRSEPTVPCPCVSGKFQASKGKSIRSLNPTSFRGDARSRSEHHLGCWHRAPYPHWSRLKHPEDLAPRSRKVNVTVSCARTTAACSRGTGRERQRVPMASITTPFWSKGPIASASVDMAPMPGRRGQSSSLPGVARATDQTAVTSSPPTVPASLFVGQRKIRRR
jgi:hypothetical protein